MKTHGPSILGDGHVLACDCEEWIQVSFKELGRREMEIGEVLWAVCFVFQLWKLGRAYGKGRHHRGFDDTRSDYGVCAFLRLDVCLWSARDGVI
jgi:hypothetical protein